MDVRYRATLDTMKVIYGVADAVARLRPGQVLETTTLDALGHAIQKPGDTVAVRILSLEVEGRRGVGVIGPGFGALNQTNDTPMLHADLLLEATFTSSHREGGRDPGCGRGIEW